MQKPWPHASPHSIWGFPKMVVPNNHWFSTKTDHFGVFWGNPPFKETPIYPPFHTGQSPGGSPCDHWTIFLQGSEGETRGEHFLPKITRQVVGDQNKQPHFTQKNKSLGQKGKHPTKRTPFFGDFFAILRVKLNCWTGGVTLILQLSCNDVMVPKIEVVPFGMS